MKKTSSAWLIATWFGCGYVPKGPGTMGALGSFVISVPLIFLGNMPAWGFAVLVLATFWPSIWASGVVARETGGKDPQLVVVDEVLGQWLTLAGAARFNWVSLLLAFGLFRLFDIWKPWPVRNFERLPGGSGIVMDDVMAGVYGALVLFVLGWLKLY